MNNVMTDIWPYLLTAVLPAIGLYAGYIHQLKTKVAVLERTIEDQAQTLEKMQKRMDSHSKKQDEILQAISKMEVNLISQFSSAEKQIVAITTKQDVITRDVQDIKQKLSQIKRS